MFSCAHGGLQQVPLSYCCSRGGLGARRAKSHSSWSPGEVDAGRALEMVAGVIDQFHYMVHYKFN